MRQPLVAGNWKLNGTRPGAIELAKAVASSCASLPVDTLVCPSFIHLPDVIHAISSVSDNIPGQTTDGEAPGLRVGAQDCCDEAEGAFTGEVSAGMLAGFGIDSVIVGHSERRQLYGDTNERVARKFARVQEAGMTPILCVGETAEQYNNGATREIISGQLQAVLANSGIGAFGSAVVAYEPVWAIGTGLTATPGQAQDVHGWLRAELASLDAGIADGLRILYGGSVKPANAAELFGQPDIDGGLIGGAALSADDFHGICTAAAGLVA